jgi:UDP-N-acetylglucosamine diphosphorylase / glucose-1-phosphate thymidylyltransferase / UDP-N-acetylgalactosamine diphosphorylase / glucosamine-1-phosphate N-acetyltransferase / galactosamine-1-phosphate N-acetyltransferase
MIWLVPMAGQGTRTRKFGKFKPFIKVNERMLVEWTLLGFRHEFNSDDNVFFITTEAFDQQFEVKNTMKNIFDKLNLKCRHRVILAEATPPGPAASVYLAKDFLDLSSPCIIVNADQFTIFKIFRNLKPMDGFIPIYFNSSPKSSYAVIRNGIVTSIHEKEPVSNYASSGVYGFGSCEGLIYAVEKLFASKLTVKGEYFIGPAMNNLLQRGGKVYPVSTQAKFDLGDEEGLLNFKTYFQDILN